MKSNQSVQDIHRNTYKHIEYANKNLGYGDIKAAHKHILSMEKSMEKKSYPHFQIDTNGLEKKTKHYYKL